MKQLIKILLLCAVLQACGQIKKTKGQEMYIITPENFVEEITKQVKKYKSEPYFKLHTGSAQNCNYEILINEFPMYKSYSGFKDLTGTPINWGVLRAGLQRVKVKVFPLKDGALLSKQTNMFFKLVEVDHTTNQFEEKNILSFVLPSDADGNFLGAGLPCFEKELTFHAVVPYELTGWSESQDLSKLDQEELKDKVLDFYNKRGKADELKNVNAKLDANFKSYMEYSIAEYFPKEEIEGIVLDLKNFVKYGKRFELTKPYAMKLYGDNRLVILEVLSGEYRGKGAHSLFVQFGEKFGYNRSTYYLHMPKGSKELKIIR